MEILASCKKILQDGTELVLEDDGLGRIEFTKRKLNTKKFVNEILKRSYEYYTENCTHNYTNADYKFCDKMTWDAIEYDDGIFDPRKRNIVAAEPHFDITIDEDWAKYEYDMPDGSKIEGQLSIKGTIDLITELDDGTIEVIDWKTGRRLNWATGEEKTYEKLCEDPQLMLYYYAIASMFPKYKETIMSIFYIRDGGPFSICFEESHKEKFLDMLKNRFEEIKKTAKPKLLSSDQSHWKCTKLCDFCKKDWPGSNESMCRHVSNHLDQFGMLDTVQNCTKEGFDIGHYEAPG
jgi:ATP-dependent helicase/DNAse subunit B